MAMSLGEHVTEVVGILAVVFSLLLAALKYIFKNMQEDIAYIKKKIDRFDDEQAECQKELPIKFVMKADFYKEIDSLWEVVNSHTHDKETGKALR